MSPRREFPFKKPYRSRGGKGYWRLVWHFLTTDRPPTPYDRHFPQTRLQRRLGRVKTLDGPIHTVWVNWATVRYNWFTLGLVCAWKGHEWRDQHVTLAPQKRLVAGDQPGHVKWQKTGKLEKYHARACARCGKFMGIGHEEWKPNEPTTIPE